MLVRVSAIVSLHRRHTLGDNARWETLSARQQILPNCHTRAGGYPRFPLARFAFQTKAYLESDRKDLVFGVVPRIAGVSFRTKFAAACRLQRLISFAQICKLIQNITTPLGGPTRRAPKRLGRDSLARGVREVVAGGVSRVTFPLPLGHRRFSVKGSFSSLIEDEGW